MPINSHANPHDREDPQTSADRPVRRDILKLGLLAWGWPASVALAAPIDPPIAVRGFRLIEPDGLKRTSYPIHATIEGAGLAGRFVLLRDGRPVEAQFRTVVREGNRHDAALDFEASLDPLESRRYEVHYGLGVSPGPEPKAGLRVEQVGDGLRVAWPGGMEIVVGPDLHAPILGAGSARLGFLKPGGTSIALQGGEPASGRREPTPGRVTIGREGPMAVALRVESAPIEGGRVASLELVLPRSQTWAEAVLAYSGPDWDRWDPKVAPALAFEPIASDLRTGPGWARFADRERSVTIGAMGPAKVSIEPEDRPSVRLDPARRGGAPSRNLEFRIHFEARQTRPGSGTGPESMLRPPRVEWDRARPDP